MLDARHPQQRYTSTALRTIAEPDIDIMNSDSDRIKELACKELYGTVFDVWVNSGRALTYSRELSEYFRVVVSPLLMEHLPTEEEFVGILLMEQARRKRESR